MEKTGLLKYAKFMLQFNLLNLIYIWKAWLFLLFEFIVLLYITLVPYHRRERSEDDYLIYSLDRKSGVKLF